MKINKWNYKRHSYDIVELPDDWNIKLLSYDMDEIINCPHCGKEFRYGNCYTSLEFHNYIGLGFPVCSECYEEEHKRRREDRGY